MRKDVKLGFSIGGVLLAVLIVYVLAVSGGKSDQTQVAQGEGSGAAAAKAGDGTVTLEPVDVSAASGAPGAKTPPVPPPAPAAQYNPPAAGPTDPFATPAGTASTDGKSSDPASSVAANGQASSSRKDDWNKILNDQLVLMTETPQAVGGTRGSATPAAVTPAPAAPAPPVPAPTSETLATPPAAPTTPSAEPLVPQTPGVTAPPVIPTVQPTSVTPPANNAAILAPAGGREHVVQIGETLSSISAAAYGNPNFYPHILRANPAVNPNRLRPGTKIVLPEISAVRPGPVADPAASVTTVSSSAAAVTPVAPLDVSRQYKVQAGDSLHKIALRLYGESTRADALYQANKQTIGDDPHRLKLGQVLQLPDPPTAAAR